MNRGTVKWRIVQAVLLIGVILAMAGLLVMALSVILLIFAGVLFGILLHDVSDWISRRTGKSYSLAYGIVVTLLLLAFGGGIYYLGSSIAQHAQTLGSELQSAAQRLSENEQVKKYLPSPEELQKWLRTISSGLPMATRTAQAVSWFLVGSMVIFFVGLYLAQEPGLYKRGLVKLIPPKDRDRATGVLDDLHASLTRWIVGQLMAMCIVGVSTAIFLWLLDVPLPVTLGVLAGFFTFVPNIGPLIAAVPQVLLALQSGPDTAAYVILFNLVMQTVESYWLTPKIQQFEAKLPPVLTISMQLLMGSLLGVIGVVVAAPLTVAAMVVVQQLYIRDQLNDTEAGGQSNDG